MARERVGPIYIYGPIGSGKTSIMRRLYEKLAQDASYLTTVLISPNVKSANAFLRIIMDSFSVPTKQAYDQSLQQFERFLLSQFQANKIPVLLVDEAQNLNRDILRLIHYLLNYETATIKLLQIVLAGQEELGVKVLRYPELASRMFPIAINAMSITDLKAMIQFRWMVAGGKTMPFHAVDDDVYKIIFNYSKGLPRTAVKICDEVLRDLVVRQKRVATASEIESIARELNLTE